MARFILSRSYFAHGLGVGSGRGRPKGSRNGHISTGAAYMDKYEIIGKEASGASDKQGSAKSYYKSERQSNPNIASSYYKSERQSNPNIASSYYKSERQSNPNIASSYYKSERQTNPNIASSYYKSERQTNPNIASSYYKSDFKRRTNPKNALKLTLNGKRAVDQFFGRKNSNG